MYQAGMEELQQELAAKAEAQAQLSQQTDLVDRLQSEVSALGAQKEQLLADLAQLADAASMVRPGPAGAGCRPCAGRNWGEGWACDSKPDITFCLAASTLQGGRQESHTCIHVAPASWQQPFGFAVLVVSATSAREGGFIGLACNGVVMQCSSIILFQACPAAA